MMTGTVSHCIALLLSCAPGLDQKPAQLLVNLGSSYGPVIATERSLLGAVQVFAFVTKVFGEVYWSISTLDSVASAVVGRLTTICYFQLDALESNTSK